MTTLQEVRAFQARERAKRRAGRSCKGCGAPEKRFKFGYTNFALGGYCAECINKAGVQLAREERWRRGEL